MTSQYNWKLLGTFKNEAELKDFNTVIYEI